MIMILRDHEKNILHKSKELLSKTVRRYAETSPFQGHSQDFVHMYCACRTVVVDSHACMRYIMKYLFEQGPGEDVKYKVELLPAEGAVQVSDGAVLVLVSLTSAVMREPTGECAWGPPPLAPRLSTQFHLIYSIRAIHILQP